MSNELDDNKKRNESLKIVVDAPYGVVGVINNDNYKKNVCVGFRTIDGIGKPFFIFGKEEENMIYDDILYEYNMINKDTTPEEYAAIKEKVRKSIKDVSIYYALREYDIKNYFDKDKENTKMALLYVDAMLKPILQKSEESEESFIKREIDTRRKALNDAGISIVYNFENSFSKDTIRNTTILEKIKVIKNAIHNKNYARVKYKGKEHISRIQTTYGEIIKNKNILGNRLKNILKQPAERENFKALREKINEIRARGTTVLFNLKKQISNGNNSSESLSLGEILKNLKLKIKLPNKKVKQPASRFTKKTKIIDKLREMAKDSKTKKKVKYSLASLFIASGLVAGGFTAKSMSNTDIEDNKVPEQTFTFSQSMDNSKENHHTENEYEKEKMREEILSSIENKPNVKENKTEKDNNLEIVNEELKEDETEESITSTSAVDEEKLEEYKIETNSIESEAEDSQINQEDEKIQNDILSQIPTSSSTASVKDLLMATLDIGFDTETKIETGKFYEAPDGSGNFGRYEKVDSDIRVSILDAVDDGKLVQYRADSGMTFSEISSEVDEVVSLHTVKDNGQLLGWNPNVEDIEIELIEGELLRISPELSQEEIDYFNSLDMNENIDIKDKEFIKHLSKLKNAQNKINSKENSKEKDDDMSR